MVGLILKIQLPSTQNLMEFTRSFPWRLENYICVWLQETGGNRACKQLMASKLSKAILEKKGKNIIEMSCALVYQVDGPRHTDKHWARRAHVLSDSALEDTYICSELDSAQNWLLMQHSAFSLLFFSWRRDSFHCPPFAKAVINLLSLMTDLAQSVRESSLALNCVRHKLSP